MQLLLPNFNRPLSLPFLTRALLQASSAQVGSHGDAARDLDVRDRASMLRHPAILLPQPVAHTPFRLVRRKRGYANATTCCHENTSLFAYRSPPPLQFAARLRQGGRDGQGAHGAVPGHTQRKSLPIRIRAAGFRRAPFLLVLTYAFPCSQMLIVPPEVKRETQTLHPSPQCPPLHHTTLRLGWKNTVPSRWPALSHDCSSHRFAAPPVHCDGGR